MTPVEWIGVIVVGLVLLGLGMLWAWAFIAVFSKSDDREYKAGSQTSWTLALLILGPLGALLFYNLEHRD